VNLKRHLTERQRKVMVALYRGQAFRRSEGCSVRSLVERRYLADSRYAGPLTGLEEAGLVASRREPATGRGRGFSLWWLTADGRGTARSLSDGSAARKPGRATVRLLEVDSGLAAALDEGDRAKAATRAVAEVLTIEPGPWTFEARTDEWRRGLGLLMLEGLLVAEVKGKKRGFMDVLGPGDLFRPWTAGTVRWEALTLARFAVLDRQLAVRLAPWPELTGVLLDRVGERSRSLPLGPLSARVLGRMATTTPAAAAQSLRRLRQRGLLDLLEKSRT
jgi:DNA-binding MarR family transcriptional regulator